MFLVTRLMHITLKERIRLIRTVGDSVWSYVKMAPYIFLIRTRKRIIDAFLKKGIIAWQLCSYIPEIIIWRIVGFLHWGLIPYNAVTISHVLMMMRMMVGYCISDISRPIQKQSNWYSWELRTVSLFFLSPKIMN